jgi:hypothetical protein
MAPKIETNILRVATLTTSLALSLGCRRSGYSGLNPAWESGSNSDLGKSGKILPREDKINDRPNREDGTSQINEKYISEVRLMDRREVVNEVKERRIRIIEDVKIIFPRGTLDRGFENGVTYSVNMGGREWLVIWADESGVIIEAQARDSY